MSMPTQRLSEQRAGRQNGSRTASSELQLDSMILSSVVAFVSGSLRAPWHAPELGRCRPIACRLEYLAISKYRRYAGMRPLEGQWMRPNCPKSLASLALAIAARPTARYSNRPMTTSIRWVNAAPRLPRWAASSSSPRRLAYRAFQSCIVAVEFLDVFVFVTRAVGST